MKRPCSYLPWTTAKQRLFYEAVNLPMPALCRVACRLDPRYFGGVTWFDVPIFLRRAQELNMLPQLWRAVKAEGGDLPGQCPFS